MAPAREDIEDAIANAGASGFDLEHVDDSNLWESEAMTLNGFVEALGERVTVARRLPTVKER
ncbi:hypothetical protein [Roseiarcus sp.]|uniref:hypothetical protein n=1 Tax=Roseiarcus sp. TaxID=1969460 RepID=UPI003F94A483